MSLSTLHFCDVLFHLVDIVQESFIDVHVPTCMGIVEIYYDLYVKGLKKNYNPKITRLGGETSRR